jgi:hypothetical protein
MDNPTAARYLLADPLAFARQLWAEACDADSTLVAHAPEAFATYAASLADLTARHPEEATFDQPLDRLADAVGAWGVAVFDEGVRFGLEAERLRRTLLAKVAEEDGAA